MKRLFAVVLAVLVLFMLPVAAMAEDAVDLKALEEALRSGASSPKDVQSMLDNAWRNGYDHCRASASRNGDSFVIEIAVRGLAPALRALAASDDGQAFMQARELLLAHCRSVIGMLQGSGAENLQFSFVLLDDTRALENEYAAGTALMTITVMGGQPVRVESVWEAWNAPSLPAVSGEMQAGETPGQSIVKREPTYILNTNSRRFHFPSCDSVAKTKAQNRQEYFGTREELLSAGYTPCGSCHP